MKIEILVKPNAKKESVEKTEAGIYRVAVHAPPQEGRANERVVTLLSEFFGVPKSNIRIVRGEKGKRKLVEILE